MIDNKLKNLPIGISSFESIINDGYLYIDKTELLYKLISTGKYYFLSRPRRFGKSLLISTLHNIFKGSKELFKGLYIYDTDFIWDRHPVIRLDFNGITNDNREIFEKDLRRVLTNIGQDEGINIDKSLSLKLLFNELITKLYEKYKRGVVFLIDEYDKPIIDHLGRGEKHLEIAKDNRDLLKSFYGTLKEGDVSDKTRFVFITGITKFARVSIFSDLNNLTDLTMDHRFSDLLGITEDEIDEYLMPYIKFFCNENGIECVKLREDLKDYYNGYKFSSRGINVYNPFSLFLALTKRSIENYWFETGTPTFLINLIKENNIYLPEYERYEADEFMFSTYELDDLSELPLMFQTGYLTIRDYDEETKIYTLDYPNKEVKESFTKSLYKEFSGLKRDTKYSKIGFSIKKGNIEEAIELIKSIYSEIPYTLMRKDRINESYFHTIFYLIITASGVGVRTEVLNSKGIIDMLIETKERYYIIEFKCNQSAERAIEQIKEKGYYKPYLNKKKEIILIGINFSTEKRNIEEWKLVNHKAKSEQDR